MISDITAHHSGGTVRVRLVGADLGDDLGFLIDELQQLPIDDITPGTAPLPPGAKSGIALTSELVLALAGSPVLIKTLTLVQDWLARRRSGSITVVIDDDRLELNAVPMETQQQALRDFLDRHRQ